jgi:hypothetical protein
MLWTHYDLAVRLEGLAFVELVTPYSWVQQSHVQGTYADVH